ncbi:MAG: ABC transporter permease [Chloroflexota bacterium]|nr:ABC transporter permease [Chloroflexota bacterium]MDE2969361.1 ABC transporter permease [Chloroflexota bacterium]
MLRSLMRRKLRTTLTVLGITVGIWALMVMSAMANKLTALVDGGSTYFNDKILVSDATNPAFGFGYVPMPVGIVDEVGAVPGVAVAAPRVHFMLDPEDAGIGFSASDFVVAFTAGVDRGHETFRWEIAQGRETAAADEGRRVVMLGADLARKFGKAPGDRMLIRGTEFEVIGVLEPTLMFFDTTAVIPWSAGQEFLARDPAVLAEFGPEPPELTSMVIVYPEEGEDFHALIQAITAAHPGMRGVTSDDFDDQFGSTVAILNAIILSVALISIVVGGLSVINTMTMSVAERTREIGIKRAIGASRGVIMRELVVEAGLMGLIGGLVGLGLAGVVVYFANDAGQTSGTILFLMTPWIGALGVSFSTVLGAVAGALPAWNAARLDPVEALRFG